MPKTAKEPLRAFTITGRRVSTVPDAFADYIYCIHTTSHRTSSGSWRNCAPELRRARCLRKAPAAMYSTVVIVRFRRLDAPNHFTVLWTFDRFSASSLQEPTRCRLVLGCSPYPPHLLRATSLFSHSLRVSDQPPRQPSPSCIPISSTAALS